MQTFENLELEGKFEITRELFCNEDIQKKLRTNFYFPEKPAETFEKILEDEESNILFENVISYFLKTQKQNKKVNIAQQAVLRTD